MDQGEAGLDSRSGEVFRRFIPTLLLAWLTVAGLAWFWSDQLHRQHLAERMATEQGHFDLVEQQLRKEFLERRSDLHMLSNLPQLRSFLDSPGDVNRQTLEAFLLHFLRSRGMYDQILLLDRQGRESVRIHMARSGPGLVAQAALQDQSDRLHFQSAIGLGRLACHVSSPVLSRERGQIRRPLNPVIHLAASVFDDAGGKRGVLVLNFQPQFLLQAIGSSLDVHPGQQVMLLNQEGYYLKHPDPAREWGWLLGQPEHRFAHDFPDLWSQVASLEHGTVLPTGGGLLIVRQLRPLLYPQSVARGDPPEPSCGIDPELGRYYRWTLLKFIPAENLRPGWLPAGAGQWAVLAGLLLLMALPAWACASQADYRRRALHKLRQQQRMMIDLYEHAPCGYQSLDQQGLVIRMNQTLLDWLGYRRDELVGKLHFRDLLTPASQQVFAEHFPSLLDSGQLHDCRLDLQRHDGTVLPVSISANVIRDGAGRFVSTRASVVDITEQRRLQQELEQQAQTDALTGLCNRRHFYTLGRRELARCARTGAPLSLLMLDIDHFKSVNDSHGHETGDQALVALAGACAPELRENDVLARLGGEEFAVLLPDTGIATARHVAERLRAALAGLSLRSSAGASLGFTVSIGVSCAQAWTADELDAMLRRADAALYRAKAAGRNQVMVDPGGAA